MAAAFAGRGIPTILSGFCTDDDNVHSANERMELRRLEWAMASAREIFIALSQLDQDYAGHSRASARDSEEAFGDDQGDASNVD